MRPKSKAIVSTVLAAVLLGSLLAGCSGGGGGGQAAGGSGAPSNQPAQSSEQPKAEGKKEERTLRIMAGVIGGKTPEENALFEQEVERLTGIKVKWEKPASDYDQKLLAAVGAGEKFDLLQISKEK